MKGLSNKEIEILLVLAKNFSKDYNANNITKEINITRQGALKAMKNLEKNEFLKSKQMGKATFYKVNLEDYNTFRTLETLFIKESREKAKRWLFEFKELEEHAEILIIFGSILREPKKANDIDLLIVFKENQYNNITKFIEQKNKILLKPIHQILQTMNDLKNNLKNNHEVVLNILKTGHILHGQDKLLEVLKNVSSK